MELHLDKIIEIAGFLVGLAYLYYEYHASPRVWICGVIMPMLSLWVYFKAGLYADFGINIYYLLIAIYGYLVWTGVLRGRHKREVPITSMPLREVLPVGVVLAGVYALLVWILVHWTDSTVPYWDAFTTALSIVGSWMLARKYVQQWLVWMVVDIVCVGLDIYKGIYLYATLYAIYTVIAWYGYRRWRRMMGGQSA